MLIPSKFSGYSFDGIRRCFAGGGGGGGGGTGGDPASIGEPTGGDPASIGDPGVGPGVPGGDGTNYVYTPTYTNTNTNTNANLGNSNNTNIYSGPGVSTPQGMATLSAMKGVPWGQSGSAYNDLLNQGFSSDQIRHSASSMYGAPSESNWSSMVQNAGMNSPTGRPMAGSDQFYQPVYSSQYQNYARPVTQFNVSSYGTQPSNSPAFNAGMSRGAINSKIGDFYNTNYRDNPNGVGMGDTLNFMRQNGINRDDFQMAGGVNNYGPQMPMSQMQSPFNPYTNSSGYGGYGGGYMPQMQNPFSYQQQSYQPSYQPQYNPYQMQSPFNYQQPMQQPNYGPSQAIVGRSSQMRGTPNVMRRAEGGITSLLDEDE
jgi:hypothetical protein